MLCRPINTICFVVNEGLLPASNAICLARYNTIPGNTKQNATFANEDPSPTQLSH